MHPKDKADMFCCLWAVVLAVLLSIVPGATCYFGAKLLESIRSEPQVTPADIYTIPPLEAFYYWLDEKYDDFQMMPAYGVTEGTKVYIGYTQGGGVYIAVFQIVDGTWEWIDTIEVKQGKGGSRSMIRGVKVDDRVRVLSELGRGPARTNGYLISDGCTWDFSKGNVGTVVSVRRPPVYVFVRVRPDSPNEGVHTFGPRDLERAE